MEPTGNTLIPSGIYPSSRISYMISRCGFAFFGCVSRRSKVQIDPSILILLRYLPQSLRCWRTPRRVHESGRQHEGQSCHDAEYGVLKRGTLRGMTRKLSCELLFRKQPAPGR